MRLANTSLLFTRLAWRLGARRPGGPALLAVPFGLGAAGVGLHSIGLLDPRTVAGLLRDLRGLGVLASVSWSLAVLLECETLALALTRRDRWVARVGLLVAVSALVVGPLLALSMLGPGPEMARTAGPELLRTSAVLCFGLALSARPRPWLPVASFVALWVAQAL